MLFTALNLWRRVLRNHPHWFLNNTIPCQKEPLRLDNLEIKQG